MSNDDQSNVPAKRDAREAVREKAQQVRVRQTRARFIRRGVIAAAIVVAVAAVAVTVTMVVGSATSRPLVEPRNVDDDGFRVTAVSGIATGSASFGDVTPSPSPSEEPDDASGSDAAAEATPAPSETAQAGTVDIRVYVDYLSEGARAFQLANVQQLTTWVSQDAATLTYYPVAMLTSKSNGSKYSMRAAAASACVATYSPETFFAFNHALLSQQPGIEADGFSDRELADLAQASGVEAPKTVRACIEEGRFLVWAKAATERALKGLPDTDGMSLTGTPTVLVNGKPYIGSLDDPAEFAQFVLTIASDAYYRSTPSPSPSVTDAPASPSPSPTDGE